MRPSPFRAIASALLLLLLAACASDGPSVARPPDDALLTRDNGVRLLLVSGGGQTGMVGHPLPEPVVVRVVDQRDQPVPDARINFLPPQDGMVDPRQTRTDADGYARATWTLGSLGLHALRVSGTGGTLVVTATARQGSGAEVMILKTSGDEQTGAPGSLLRGGLQVRMLRDDGTPVKGAVLTWRVAAGGGSVDMETSRTNLFGYAVRRWTLGTEVGEQRLTVSTPGADSVTFTAQALNAVLEKSAGDGQTGVPGLPLGRALQVRATRADGSPAAGVALTWTVTGGGGTVLLPSPRTSAAGTGQARWVLGREDGPQTVTVSAPGAEPVTFTATAGGLRLEKTSGDGQTGTPGAMLRGGLRVRVVTAGGLPVPGAPLTWTVTSGGGSLDATESRASLLGVSVRRWTLGPELEQSVTVSTPGAEPVVFTATARGGAPRPAALVLSPDSLLLDAGGTGAFTATVKDANGATLPGHVPQWSSSDAGVAAVDADGTVRAVAGGRATVTARVGALTATAAVRVRDRGPTLQLFPDSLVLDIGVRAKVFPVARDASGRPTLDYRLEWSSSDDYTVFVMADGTLHPMKAGTARVTARWGAVTASIPVRVRPARGTLTIPQIQKRVSAAGGSIDPSTRDVELNFWVHTSVRGVSTISMRVRGPSGRTIDCVNVGAENYVYNEFRCQVHLPRGSEPGVWRVDRVTVTKDGSTTVFTGADLDAMGTLGRTFDVFGTGMDTQPPLVRMLWEYQGGRQPDVYYLRIGVVDHVAGVRSVRITVRGPGGVTHSCEASQSNGALAKVGGGVCRLPLRPGSGTWDVVSVEVEDGAGNRATYSPEQVLQTAAIGEEPFALVSFTP